MGYDKMEVNEYADFFKQSKHIRVQEDFCDMVFGVEINVVGYGANVEHICKKCAYDALREFARKNLGMTDTFTGDSNE